MDFYGAIDSDGLCLISGVVIRPKFKTPAFEKYDGTKCPVSHLTMYCRKMAAHTEDEKLLMHVFQDTLTGSAARWYAKLNRDRVTTWNELARAFIAQYKHIADMGPDRLSLQNMEKKPTEGFKKYAQRWRDTISQVQPPLTERETTMLFINTLKGPYYDHLVGNAARNFADMVLSGEIIENAIKSGKMDGGLSGANEGSNSEEE